MNAYRIETTLKQDGTVTLDHIPFQAGEPVEIIILTRAPENKNSDNYSLRGTPVQYFDPCEPVAIDDWEALQ